MEEKIKKHNFLLWKTVQITFWTGISSGWKAWIKEEERKLAKKQ